METDRILSSFIWTLTQRGIATLSYVEGVPSLVAAYTDQSASGNWWKHPRANDIWNAYQAILADPDILTTKLVLSKVSFVHRALWPSLRAIVLDSTWRASGIDRLDVSQRQLLQEVELNDQIRLDAIADQYVGGRKRLTRDRKALEVKALVLSGEEHTFSGAHWSFLTSWKYFFEVHSVSEDKPTIQEARELLRERVGLHRTTLDR